MSQFPQLNQEDIDHLNVVLRDLLKKSEANIALLVEKADRDIRAFPGKGQGYGAADAAVAPGDQRHLVLQAAVAPVAALAVIGARAQLLLLAGVLLLLLGEVRSGTGLPWIF